MREKGELLRPNCKDKKVLDEAKETLGSHGFQAQYQQDPVPPGGNMIKHEWFKRYDKRPDRDCFSNTVQSWDTATETGEQTSYTVATTWGVRENRYYLLDVFRDRLDFPSLKQKVVRHAQTWGADAVLIEKAANRRGLWPGRGSEESIETLAIARTMRGDGEPVRPGIGTPRITSRTNHSAKQNGTQSAETIKASGHVHRANRPDTRLHPTTTPTLQIIPCNAGAIHTGRSQAKSGHRRHSHLHREIAR